MWSQLSTTDPHVSYACIAFGLIIVMTVALILKHRFDFSEVIISTIFGLIVGPHCIGWFVPSRWTNDEDSLTLELARIVMDIQIFSASAELPPKYVWHSAQSLLMLLLPIMIGGYAINSVFIWGLLPKLRWIEALVIAGCVTATDPVLASAVLSGPGFAQRLPRRLVHILSAESASNDGMALPFVMLPLYIILHEHNAPEIAKDFIVLTVLYQVIFAITLGAVIGFLASLLFKEVSLRCEFREEYMLIYNVVLAVFCAGIGSLLGCDDFLVSFAAGAAFSWNGWVHSVVKSFDITGFIDLILNSAFFVYFGSVIPWEKFNSSDIAVWRLIVIIILILIGRRLPFLAIFKPAIPDLKTWKDVLIAGHFGPIGVAAIYMCLESERKLEEGVGIPEYPTFLLHNLWPVVSFVVLGSIIVHGTSVVTMNLVQHGYTTIKLSKPATTKKSDVENAPSEPTDEASKASSVVQL